MSDISCISWSIFFSNVNKNLISLGFKPTQDRKCKPVWIILEPVRPLFLSRAFFFGLFLSQLIIHMKSAVDIEVVLFFLTRKVLQCASYLAPKMITFLNHDIKNHFIIKCDRFGNIIYVSIQYIWNYVVNRHTKHKICQEENLLGSAFQYRKRVVQCNIIYIGPCYVTNQMKKLCFVS